MSYPDNQNPLLDTIFSLGGKIIDASIGALIPDKYEYQEEKIGSIRLDPGSELRILRNRLDLGQINMVEYETERQALLIKYEEKIKVDIEVYGGIVDYCPSCHAPLPLRDFGTCEYCSTPYDKSDMISIIHAIESTHI